MWTFQDFKQIGLIFSLSCFNIHRYCCFIILFSYFVGSFQAPTVYEPAASFFSKTTHTSLFCFEHVPCGDCQMLLISGSLPAPCGVGSSSFLLFPWNKKKSLDCWSMHLVEFVNCRRLSKCLPQFFCSQRAPPGCLERVVNCLRCEDPLVNISKDCPSARMTMPARHASKFSAERPAALAHICFAA